MQIEKTVSDGEDFTEYFKALSPEGVPMPEPCQDTLKIADFQLGDIDTVEVAPKLSKEEKAYQFPIGIIKLSKILADPIILTYLVGDVDNSNSIEGSAVKLS
jgi:hypothetical protein